MSKRPGCRCLPIMLAKYGNNNTPVHSNADLKSMLVQCPGKLCHPILRNGFKGRQVKVQEISRTVLGEGINILRLCLVNHPIFCVRC